MDPENTNKPVNTTESSVEPTSPATTGDDASTPATPPVAATVMPPAKKPGSPLLKLILIVLTLFLLAGACYLLYTKVLHKAAPATQATAVKHDIPLITYGYQAYGFDNALYPAATNLDPNYDVNQQIFEGLVQFKNINQIKPNLATSWTNPDDSTWDFKLERNVKFHTGRMMTAADVKHSLENFNTSEYGKVFGSTIKNVEVVNDYEVKVTTKGPDPILLNKLAFLYIIDSKSDLKNDARNGTGPFTLKEGTTPSEKQLDLVAFDSWHGGRPMVRALTFKVYADETSQLEAAQKGDINLIGEVFETKTQSTLAALPNFKDLRVKNIGETVFRINTKRAKSPLANKLVRQALYASVDASELLKARNVDAVLVNQIVPKDVLGYNPDIQEHKRDVSKAKALLAQAGYPNGVTIGLLYLDNGSQVPAELAKEAKEAGITINLDVRKDPSELEPMIAAGSWDLAGYSISSNLLDASDVFLAYLQGQDYNNPTVTDLATQASKTIDPAKRLKLLQQMSQTVVDDVALIPLYSRVQHWYASPSFVLTRDVGSASLGVNFGTVYADK